MTFAELHALSNYSFLRGASHPEELVRRAAELGYRAIALTDECSFAGLVKAHVAARELEVQLIVGAEFRLVEGFRLVLLAPDRAAYGQLSALITRLRRRSPKGSYEARLEDFRWAIDGCLALWVPTLDDIGTLMAQGRRLKALFPALWIALELFREATDLDKTAHALTLSMRLDLPIVASNDVHAHVAERQPLQDVLTAIRHRIPVSEIGSLGFQNAERHLRPLAELETLYPPEMLDEAGRIAGRCSFSLDELRYEYPEELVPPHLSPADYLRQLTYAGAAERWPDGMPEAARSLVERELALIGELGFEYYFLTVQDIVAFARSQNILCQGRGSAANSAVCYCLHITEVDPSRMHLLFERFVNQERNEPPDIDVDFEHERREEVIQYLYRRYTRERAALAATLITYRPKSAIRDVGKALGMCADVVDLLAKSLAWWDNREALAERFVAVGLDPHSEVVRQFRYFVDQILGFPRHLSQHVGGFVISRGPLAQLVPVENAAMAERTVIQWDKDDLEALGLLKVDVLALGMLSAIRRALEFLGLQMHEVPAEDPAVYAMIQKADTVGVFQIESRAQMSMLPRLRPACFYDLVIEVAIVRPGPIQGGMVHPYLRRRRGQEPVAYPSAAVQGVLERTLGVPIFQEQVMQLAVVAAGFTPGEADRLRRSMAAWKRKGGLEPFRERLVQGMLERGYRREFAEGVYRQILGFGEYGFPESHSASFALLVYVSAWLKCHHPAAFCAALLNSQPMGFYAPAQLVQDARRHGVEVRPPDVGASLWDCTLEDGSMRLGLRMLSGLAQAVGARIVAARAQDAFASVEDLARRAELSRRDLRCLAAGGALAGLAGHRRQAHWAAAGITQAAGVLRAAPIDEPALALPPPGEGEDIVADYASLGLSLGRHPLALLRPRLARLGLLPAAAVQARAHGSEARAAGLVTCRQRPDTASGVIFVTLEDETGCVNVVVWRDLIERQRRELLGARLLAVEGRIERDGEVVHLIARQLSDRSALLGRLLAPSRDFH